MQQKEGEKRYCKKKKKTKRNIEKGYFLRRQP